MMQTGSVKYLVKPGRGYVMMYDIGRGSRTRFMSLRQITASYEDRGLNSGCNIL